jgi:hypothetical protein
VYALQQMEIKNLNTFNDEERIVLRGFLLRRMEEHTSFEALIVFPSCAISICSQASLDHIIAADDLDRDALTAESPVVTTDERDLPSSKNSVYLR